MESSVWVGLCAGRVKSMNLQSAGSEGVKTMTKPGLKGDTSSEGNGTGGVLLQVLVCCAWAGVCLSLWFDRRYLNSAWGDNWGCWCQLQLAQNKPTPVWGQSLSEAVPPPFLPQNSSCSPPTMEHSWVPGLFQQHEFCLHFFVTEGQILPLAAPTSTKLRAQCWNSSSGSSRLGQHSSLS